MVADVDDDFLTPLSTPPGELAEADATQADTSQRPTSFSVDSTMTSATIDMTDFGNSAITAESLRDRMYDRYALDMSDLQILVARGSENWRMSHTRGLCHLQMLEKFSISVKVERRLAFTTDPQWPSMTLSGNLPSLSIHVNERKTCGVICLSTLHLCFHLCSPCIPHHLSFSPPVHHQIQALNNCMKIMSSNSSNQPASPVVERPVSETLDKETKGRTHYTSQSDLEATIRQRTQALLEESRLLEMQFSVDKMSLEVQSRGRCISEFQVSRVKTMMTKRPYDMSVSLSVHSLLVIDALQQFGPDFELLLASHKDLSLHAPSGSIVDSEASTPRSPTSPRSPASPAETMMASATHAELASAIQQMGSHGKGGTTLQPLSVVPPSMSPSLERPLEEREALITVELELISAECPSNTNDDGPMQVAVIQFNSLDLIANQETIVELLSFFRRAFPDEETKAKTSPSPDEGALSNTYFRDTSIIEVPTADH
ncbi:intermembrane lipid transfer protein VPS13D-like [Diadema antillarum]|uniref:intermembrane lipid transfer protein VPS13D-like n=1 Tax=Diadema antillarum TaxID=105358 RepID=UPI003A874B67